MTSPSKAHKRAPLKKAPKPAVRRRDGTGHLDPAYQKALMRESTRQSKPDDERAFLSRPRSADALAEQMGETVVHTATSGEYDVEDVIDQKVPEEDGGPFVETSGDEEFAEGTDESNIKEATREPFPTT